MQKPVNSLFPVIFATPCTTAVINLSICSNSPCNLLILPTASWTSQALCYVMVNLLYLLYSRLPLTPWKLERYCFFLPDEVWSPGSPLGLSPDTMREGLGPLFAASQCWKSWFPIRLSLSSCCWKGGVVLVKAEWGKSVFTNGDGLSFSTVF